jgi:hypothetical protein
MITKEEFLILYEKNLSGKCTPGEKQLLEAYQDEISMPDDKWNAQFGNKKHTRQILKANIRQTLHHDQSAHVSNKRLYLKIAAAAIVFFTAGILVLKQHSVKTKVNYAVKNPVAHIVPGSNKAYLTTANGTIITLNGLKNGNLLSQGGIQVNKVKDGLLKYGKKVVANSAASITSDIYNTITVPRGGQYQLVLADGTKVWLNSASTIKFPVAFTGKDRQVELSGEAYFEVVKNPLQPFKVVANGITVQDLGTHFNVMAYSDDKEVKTSLLEGSVKLTGTKAITILKPGEQGVLNDQQNAFKIEKVDMDDVVAWKNGFFAFNDEDIQTIMKRISRWYDVDVVFPQQFKRKNFGGTVSRFADVSQVLKDLELTGSIHFKIEGRRIAVMP